MNEKRDSECLPVFLVILAISAVIGLSIMYGFAQFVQYLIDHN